MDQSIERDSQCFCCGADNEKGLRLVFAYPTERTAETWLEVPEYFSGWKRMTHGGFLSMLLDEAMAHACIQAASSAVTGEITVRFLKPVETGTRIHVLGKAEEIRGRIISTRGWIHDPSGSSLAEATAKFLIVGARER
jgi:uncharacterized protein (TIGR00369 family)